MRTKFLQSKLEENIDLKNQFRYEISPDDFSIREAASGKHVDNIFKEDIDFNDVKLEKIKFVKEN